MSTRGVKFLFKSNEHVLCFEPDSSKAKVLYDAKILDVSVSTDKKGKRRPTYLIHFLGWNSSWDRVVPESFLLKDNEENQALMRKLSVVCQRVKRNRLRIKKIDSILQKHFQKRPGEGIGTSIPSTNSSVDDEMEDDRESVDVTEASRTSDDDLSDESDNHSETEDSQQSEDSDQSLDNDEDRKREPVELDLPEALKQKLERDCYLVKKKNKLLKLPARPNVVTILEDYAKTFAINLLCATVGKQKSHHLRSQTQQTPEKSIDLCKEVMSGLRIVFDFTLPLILLYEEERAQLKLLAELPATARHLSTSETNKDLSTTTCASSKEHRSETANVGDVSSDDDTVLLSKDKGKQLERHKEEKERKSPEKDDSPPRRITRHSSGARDLLKAKDVCMAKSNASSTSCELSKTETIEKRSSRRSVRESTRSAGTSKDDCVAPMDVARTEIVSLLDNSVSKPDQTESTSSLGTSNLPPSLQFQTAQDLLSKQVADSQKDAAVNDVFNWRLVLDDLYDVVPTPPSLNYGAHHLLRLFVKLPQLLSDMDITASYLPHLLRHLEMFLEHLQSRSEELLSETAYVNAK